MKKGLTEIVLLLDASGSMGGLTNATIESANSFINDQAACKIGEARLSLYTFNMTKNNLVQNSPISKDSFRLSHVNYEPYGSTALVQSMTEVIDEIGTRLGNTAENERPEHIIFITITDGEENSSRPDFTLEKLKEKISHQTDVYKWNFIYAGANQDAFKTGKTYGFNVGSTTSYNSTAQGTRTLYSTVSASCLNVRSAVTAPENFFTKEDQDKIEKTK